VKINTHITRAAATITLALMAGGAHAQATNLKEVSTNISTQLVALGSLAGIVAFLTGFVFGIMGFMKLKANASNPNDPSNKVSTGFMLIFIGAGLIAVPTVMGVGIGSIFGAGGQNTELSTSSQPFTAIK
jgi:flagellar biosynthesis protein FliP